MTCYLNSVEARLAKMVDWWFNHTLLEENEKADALAGVVVTLPITESIMLLVYIQAMSSITSERIHDVAHVDVGWMHLIANYLRIGEVTEDGK